MANTTTSEKKPHFHGHRQRLKARFMAHGGDKLPDYELLELVLGLAIPRRDVKPLAKELITTFGSFASVIHADPSRLQETKGIGQSAVLALKLVRESGLRLGQYALMDQPAIASWDTLVDYCRAAMAYGTTEQFRILFLDKKNKLIADEVQQTGTIDHTPVYPREVIKRALDLGASGIILVHNHPSGDPTPSTADIEITREVAEAGKRLRISVHDHIIVGRSGETSFKTLGLL